MATASQQNRGVRDQFEMVLRLQQSRNSQLPDAELSAHVLVQDILRARLQVEAQVGDENHLHARGLSELGKTLAAARALQLAFEGFRSAAPARRATISLVLDAPGPEQAAGPSVADLLALAKPSQVLITQSLYERIAHTQPVGLRSFPACAGVYEFLWTSAERLDELRAEGEFMPTLVVDPEPAVMEVQETVISYPAPRFAELTAHNLERPAALEHAAAPVYDDEEKPSRPVGKIIGLSAVAAVLIAGCGLAAWKFLPLSPAVPQRPPVVAATPAPVTPPPMTPSTVITDPPPLTPAPAPSPKARVAADAKPPALAPVTRSAKCSIENYEIPQYLDLADKNRNRGQYDAAEREYTTVLGCQPGNRVARDGLARLHGH